MNPVRTDYNSVRSSIEAHLSAGLRPIETSNKETHLNVGLRLIETSDLVDFKNAFQELNETELDRLSDFITNVDKAVLESLQNRTDVVVRENLSKLISLKNITKIAVGILLFLGAYICHGQSQHVFGFFLSGLGFAEINQLSIDLGHQRNSPKIHEKAFELLKNAQQGRVTQLTNQILTVKNDRLQAKLEVIAAERDAIAADKKAAEET